MLWLRPNREGATAVTNEGICTKSTVLPFRVLLEAITATSTLAV